MPGGYGLRGGFVRNSRLPYAVGGGWVPRWEIDRLYGSSQTHAGVNEISTDQTMVLGSKL